MIELDFVSSPQLVDTPSTPTSSTSWLILSHFNSNPTAFEMSLRVSLAIENLLLLHVSFYSSISVSPSIQSSGSATRCAVRQFSAKSFIHDSIIPTFKFQDSLPKLPVPKLEDTLKKWESQFLSGCQSTVYCLSGCYDPGMNLSCLRY